MAVTKNARAKPIDRRVRDHAWAMVALKAARAAAASNKALENAIFAFFRMSRLASSSTPLGAQALSALQKAASATTAAAATALEHWQSVEAAPAKPTIESLAQAGASKRTDRRRKQRLRRKQASTPVDHGTSSSPSGRHVTADRGGRPSSARPLPPAAPGGKTPRYASPMDAAREKPGKQDRYKASLTTATRATTTAAPSRTRQSAGYISAVKFRPKARPSGGAASQWLAASIQASLAEPPEAPHTARAPVAGLSEMPGRAEGSCCPPTSSSIAGAPRGGGDHDGSPQSSQPTARMGTTADVQRIYPPASTAAVDYRKVTVRQFARQAKASPQSEQTKTQDRWVEVDSDEMADSD
jgi:hypothetical protein